MPSQYIMQPEEPKVEKPKQVEEKKEEPIEIVLTLVDIIHPLKYMINKSHKKAGFE